MVPVILFIYFNYRKEPHNFSKYSEYAWLDSVNQPLCNYSQDLNLTAEEAVKSRVSAGGREDGEGQPAVAEVPEDATAAAECMGGVSNGSTSVLSLSSTSQEQLLDEHLEECPLCLLSQPLCRFPQLTSCSHRTCSDCLRQYLRIEISESRVGIACPQCPETLAPLDVRAILDDRALLDRFEEYQLRRFLAADPDTRWCPAPDCRWEEIVMFCCLYQGGYIHTPSLGWQVCMWAEIYKNYWIGYNEKMGNGPRDSVLNLRVQKDTNTNWKFHQLHLSALLL